MRQRESPRCSVSRFMCLRSSADNIEAKHVRAHRAPLHSHFGCSRNKWLVSASNFVTPSAAVAS
jgi:hypothetical protein